MDCLLQAELTAAVDRLAHSRRGGVKGLALHVASPAAAQEQANRGLRQRGQRGRQWHQLATLKPAHAAALGLAALSVRADQAVGPKLVLLVVQESQAAGTACLAQGLAVLKGAVDHHLLLLLLVDHVWQESPLICHQSGGGGGGNKVVPAKRARRLA